MKKITITAFIVVSLLMTSAFGQQRVRTANGEWTYGYPSDPQQQGTQPMRVDGKWTYGYVVDPPIDTDTHKSQPASSWNPVTPGVWRPVNTPQDTKADRIQRAIISKIEKKNNSIDDLIISECIVSTDMLIRIFSMKERDIPYYMSQLEHVQPCLIRWASRCSVEPIDASIIKFLNEPNQSRFWAMQAIPIGESYFKDYAAMNMTWFKSWTKDLINYSKYLPKDANSLNQMYEATVTEYLDKIEQMRSMPNNIIIDSLPEITMKLLVLRTKCQH